MKMYHFEFQGYGDSYHVMAKSPNDALDSLKRFLKYNIEDEYSKMEYDLWKSSSVNDLPKNYIIKELDEGKVITTSCQ